MRATVLLVLLAGCSHEAQRQGSDLATHTADLAMASAVDLSGVTPADLTGVTPVDLTGGASADLRGVDGSSMTTIVLPTPNAKLDYQLGGAYAPPAGVQIVSRDRTAAPAAGLFNLCYVNGFQIQPDELADWEANRPALILRDGGGDPIIDADWNEALIDVSTADKRAQVALIVGDWIDGCAQAGFDAIEIDNLDTYSRSQGLLAEDHAVAMIRLFADHAHAAGLPIAQKNSAELIGRKSEMQTDFAVAEECNRYAECQTYRDGYGDLVFVIEYRLQDFTKGCTDFPGLSIVLRDLDLVTPSDSGYVYDGC